MTLELNVKGGKKKEGDKKVHRELMISPKNEGQMLYTKGCI